MSRVEKQQSGVESSDQKTKFGRRSRFFFNKSNWWPFNKKSNNNKFNSNNLPDKIIYNGGSNSVTGAGGNNNSRESATIILENNNMKMKGALLCSNDIPPSDDLKLTTGERKHKPISLFDIKLIVLLFAFVVSLSGTVLMWFTDVYNDQIFQRLTLANGTPVHTSWKNPPLEPLLCVHIFNYSNADEFLEGDGVKLKITEVGPYCYKETIERINIKFLGNGSLSYNERRTHNFAPEASGGTEADLIIVPNVPAISVYALTANLNWLGRFSVNAILGAMSTKPFVEKNVTEFLFGYSDSIVEASKRVADILGRPGHEKFGILMKRAGLSKDLMTIQTGEKNLEEMGQVTNINGISKFTSWNTTECNMVGGSDGLFFKRSKIKSHQEVGLFHKDSCRALPLQYNSTVDVGGGVMANRYRLKDTIFDNDLSENQCYCVNDVCKLANGIFDISKCTEGIPMLISRPHFLRSNLPEDSTVLGLLPDPSKHGFHIDVFPPLGLTVRTVMRMQMNIMIRNPHHEKNLGPLQDKFILPITWVEMNSGEVPAKMYSLLYHITYTMKWIELSLMWGFIILLVTFAILVTRYSMYRTTYNNEIFIVSKKHKASLVSSNNYE